MLYHTVQASEAFAAYRKRHGIESASILSVEGEGHAALVAKRLWPYVVNKTVIEIGGGTGVLALELGRIAKRVYCIEADPLWSLAFLYDLIARKPPNVSYLFGAASEFDGVINGDVAIFCAHIGVDSLAAIAGQFAPIVIDVYGELFGRNAREAEKHLCKLRAAGLR